MSSIGDTAQIDRIRVKEQASAPATPASGYGLVYEKADGILYFLNDAGVEVPLGAGVSSLNALIGAIQLQAGSNISINLLSGGVIEIAATGGSSGVNSVNGLTGDVVLQAGAGLTAALQSGGVILIEADVEAIQIACSDETTALTTGTAKVTFRMPYALTLTAVRASVTTAPTGSVLTVDINEGGSTILSTKLTIDAGEKTSTTAATPPVISDPNLADDAEITIDIDGVGSTIAGAGLKVTLIGTRA